MPSDIPCPTRSSSGFLRAFSVFALAALSAPARAQEEWQEQDPLTEFVEGCKAALTGGEVPRANSGLLIGRGSLWGRPGKVQLLVQPGPCYLFEFDGELDVAWAVSPRSNWEVDPSGAQWWLEGADVERRLWLALVASGDWLFDPEFAPAISVELGEDDGEGELRHARLKLEHGLLDARLSVYRASKLPARLVLDDGNVEQTIEFSQWSEGPGHLWPKRITIDGAASGTAIEFEGFGPPPSYLVDPFARQVPIEDLTVDAGAPAEVDCKLAVNGQWLVHPRVDGRDVGWFVFDPATSMSLLDPKTQHALELAPLGRRNLQGAGTTEVDVVRARALTLGPASLRAPLFAVIDLSRLSAALGVELAGVVGADFARRTVIELEREAPRLALRRAEGYVLEGATWTPLHLERRAPCLEARFAHGSEALRLDFGAGRELLLHSPAVERHRLLEGRTTTPAGADAVRGELAALTVGGLELERVSTLFATARRGPLALRTSAGIVPSSLFRAKRIVLDVGSRRIAFVDRSK